MLAFLLQRTTPSALTNVIAARAISMIARGDFSFTSEALGLRIDLIEKTAHGAIFHTKAANPLTGGKVITADFIVPDAVVRATRRFPAPSAVQVQVPEQFGRLNRWRGAR